jgi:formylglycine-generating enzyme required for sulfatase activity/serine/threonine protein kinase
MVEFCRAAMAQTLDHFRQQIVASGLLSGVELSDWLDGLPVQQRPVDAEQLARELVRQKRLTAWQVKAIYQGQGKSLLMGNYVVLDKLGQGGMGMVLKARHRRMNRLVALKVLAPGTANSPLAIKRFHREVQAAARLEHPNIVTAYDADEANGKHFLVMQFVDGCDLASLVTQEGRLPVEKAVGCVLQAARGLEYAHQHGVVHRDIKPANLLLQRDGTIKILDMGLARIDAEAEARSQLTGTGQVMGTVDFMPPEQAIDTKRADQRADIYSLGITLWYLLVGQVPYGGETMMSRLLAHRDHPIPALRDARSEVPAAVDALFRRMVAKRPEDRYQSMTEVIAALEGCRLSGAAPELAAEQSDDLLLNDFLNSLRQKEQGTAAVSKTVAATVAMPHLAAADYHTLPAGEAETNPQVHVANTGSVIAVKEVRPDRSLPLRHWVAAAACIVLAMTGVAASLNWGSGEAPPTQLASDGNSAKQPPIDLALQQRSPKPQPQRISTGNPAQTNSPPPAVAPFDANQAKRHQRAWAEYLGTQVEIKNSVAATMVLLPPGRFLMGSSDEQVAAALKLVDEQKVLSSAKSENKRRIETWERPQHRVEITRPLRVAATEVTVGQFRKFVEASGCVTEAEQAEFGNSGAKKLDDSIPQKSRGINWRQPGYAVNDDFPVTQVSWNDAQAYCKWLSAAEGTLYRLPTEADWEYACRAGSAGQFSFGDDADLLGKYAWHKENSGSQIQRVGQLLPNSFGLHDLHGNVVEWCSDVFEEQAYGSSATHDPTGPATGAFRSVRGGAWDHDSSQCRNACRSYHTAPSFRFMYTGFRVVCEVPEARVATIEVAKPGASRSADGRHGWPADAPPPAKAPFDAKQALAHQEAWAKYLGAPLEYTNSIGMKFRLIPPGEFEMGSTPEHIASVLEPIADELIHQKFNSEAPPHHVVLTQPFYLGAFELRQQDYRQVTGTNPSAFSSQGGQRSDPQVVGQNTDLFPVEQITWKQAIAFCEALNAREQIRTATGSGPTSAAPTGYSLPTEAQWEFACRAGTEARYWVGEDWDALSAKAGADGRRSAVDVSSPNGFGLYRTLGNVFEFCRDWWRADSYLTVQKGGGIDPYIDQGVGPVCRGGSFNKTFCRSAARSYVQPDEKGASVGVRVSLSVDSVKELLNRDGSRGTSPNGVTSKTAPPPVKAPFDAKQARAHQQAWADYLGVPLEIENKIGMKMILIPPGEFLMRSTPEEIEDALKTAPENYEKIIRSELPQHRVALSQPFYASVSPLTVRELRQFVDATGYQTFVEKSGKGWDKDPRTGEKAYVAGIDWKDFAQDEHAAASQLTWYDARALCNWLNEQEALPTRYAGRDDPPRLEVKVGYRLPSEAQWEYLCRAGTTTPYWWGDTVDDLLRLLKKSELPPTEQIISKLPANAFGIRGMGLETEWCEDLYHYDAYQRSAADDSSQLAPAAASELGSQAVRRGPDAFNARYSFWKSRSSARNYSGKSFPLPRVRLIRTLPMVADAQPRQANPAAVQRATETQKTPR